MHNFISFIELCLKKKKKKKNQDEKKWHRRARCARRLNYILFYMYVLTLQTLNVVEVHSHKWKSKFTVVAVTTGTYKRRD